MGIPFTERLEDGEIYVCRNCQTHLTKAHSLISKHFTGKTGKAFLFGKLCNYTAGPQEDRDLRTGKHVCADIFCAQCFRNIGWTYIHAYEETEQYKVGKFILERALVEKINDV
mmetsp:Transcript_4441/g.5601  ORF Transcript_4441/g.5601 Transcript_4441/m.5601 type:complete len:113 (-) Transcript_4441:1588-1926(-)